jgi:hypothetical protein
VNDCELRIEVRDHDRGGSGDFLGQVVLKGDDLLQLPQRKFDYALKKKPELPAKKQKVKGLLGLQFTLDTKTPYTPVSTPAAGCLLMLPLLLLPPPLLPPLPLLLLLPLPTTRMTRTMLCGG